MKSVAQLKVIDGALPAQPEPEVDSGALNSLARQQIDNVFIRLKAIFPAWRNAYPTPKDEAEAKRNWVRAFVDADIRNTEQLARGMRRARLSGSDFFPSVGKFIAWCQPLLSDYGLPSPDLAYREAATHAGRALKHEWSHAGVYEAGRRCGWYDLRNGDVSESRFLQHYEAVCQAVMAGEHFEVPRPDASDNPYVLEHHSNGQRLTTEEAKAVGQQALGELKKAVGLCRED